MTEKTTRCPKCEHEVQHVGLIKEWDATPRRQAGEIKVMIHYWRCPHCGTKFRTATRTWPKEDTQKPRRKPSWRFGRPQLFRGPKPS